jgi:hypothetical protein
MDSGEPTIWFSIQVNDGDSGGGIFDSQNRLVAITHGRQLSGEVSAIPISAMIGLVEQTKSRLTSQGVAFRYHQKCEKCGEYHEEGIELTQL